MWPTLTHRPINQPTNQHQPTNPRHKVAENVAKYPNATEVAWAQEEPKNMGAWMFVHDRILTATREINGAEVRPTYVGRKTMASPAEGYGDVHTREQDRIAHEAIVD